MWRVFLCPPITASFTELVAVPSRNWDHQGTITACLNRRKREAWEKIKTTKNHHRKMAGQRVPFLTQNVCTACKCSQARTKLAAALKT